MAWILHHFLPRMTVLPGFSAAHGKGGGYRTTSSSQRNSSQSDAFPRNDARKKGRLIAYGGDPVLMAITISRFLQWKPNVFLYRKLGWRFTSSYLFFLGSLYFALKQEEREKISRSLEEAFGLKKTTSDLEKRILQGILFHYFEKIYNAYEGLPGLTSFLRDHISAPSLHKLDDALKQNKGVLFVTGHYGGVEYIPIFIGMHQYPVSVVFKCATSQLQDTLHKKARDLGIRVIDPSQGKTIPSVLRDLRENRIVFIECDEIEAWKPSHEEKMLFLGRQIGVDRTLNLLRKRSGAEIVFGILHRSDLSRYSFIIETYQDILSHLGNVPSSPAAAVLKFLEHYIYAYPEEWYQWKVHESLETPPLPTKTAKAKGTIPLLKPSFRPAW
jgi:Kdo2-lipid IVA lauroyltransferase/acyltransferase